MKHIETKINQSVITMHDNPFVKGNFKCYRDWEDALLTFFLSEAKSPNFLNWVKFSNDCNEVDHVVYSALFLSNLLETNNDYKDQSSKLYDIYNTIKSEQDGQNFNEWLKSGWVDLARVASSLKSKLVF